MNQLKLPLWGITSALGVAQILSWGSLFYAITVLGANMQRDLGVSQNFLFAGFTLSLFLSGWMAPPVGRLMDRHGARPVLAAGSGVAGLALLALAAAGGPYSLLLAMALAGLAMAVCLYDAAFIALHQISGASYRRAVTLLTLFGGFASTLFWPLSQLMQEHMGWRLTLACYGLLQFLVCLPLHGFLLPQGGSQGAAPAVQTELPAPPPDAGFLPLSLAFALGSFVLSGLAIHMIEILHEAGLDTGQAVAVAALVGPMQVLGRLLELACARSIGPLAVGSLTFVLLLLALAALYFVRGMSALAFLFVALFGLSNGLLTIARGIVPAAFFGQAGYGALMGRLARPVFFARAIAPLAIAVLLGAALARQQVILALALLAVLSFLAYRLALRRRRPWS